MTQGLAVPVAGGSLNVLRFGSAGDVAVVAHGITGSGMSFNAVASHLPPGWTLLAADLRGRGHSAHLPGPYGLANHARDICAVAEYGIARRRTAGRVVLAGHSMGGYVALLAAVSRPELFERLVLIDGGLPLPVPDGADLDRLLDTTVGPAIARLSMTFPSEQAYLDFFRAHPALGPHWNADIAEYVSYDLTGEPPAMRSRAREEAVRVDGRDLLGSGEALAAALRTLDVPTLVLAATSGMFGEPPGFLPEPVIREWRRQRPDLHTELVPGTNHYTLLFGPAAAGLVASRLTDPSTWPAATGPPS